MIRLSDLIISVLALLVLFPIFVLVPIFIYLEDGAPILFLQLRVGKDLKKFKIYKFRTMTHDKNRSQGESVGNLSNTQLLKIRAEVSTSSNFDSRITKAGQFLRKSSIDELPQLFNVIKGHMSLVGPRPDTPIQEIDYRKSDWEMRHCVKPGITGLAQIKGRSDITLDERVRLDIEYTKKISVFLYYKILFQTLFLVIRFKGVN